MSRFEKLEDTFEMPRLEDVLEQNQLPVEQVVDEAKALEKTYKEQDPFEIHDEEMDEISHMALEYGKSLHDLGMSVEVKNAGEIFTASSNMIKIALDARNMKMEKKLKLLRLELDRLKLDRTAPDQGETIQAENVTVLDRNTLLDQIREVTKQNNK